MAADKEISYQGLVIDQGWNDYTNENHDVWKI